MTFLPGLAQHHYSVTPGSTQTEYIKTFSFRINLLLKVYPTEKSAVGIIPNILVFTND